MEEIRKKGLCYYYDEKGLCKTWVVLNGWIAAIPRRKTGSSPGRIGWIRDGKSAGRSKKHYGVARISLYALIGSSNPITMSLLGHIKRH